jgi:hypothetical protein
MFKIGIEPINLVTIGVIGDGINQFPTFGMMITDGDKEV